MKSRFTVVAMVEAYEAIYAERLGRQSPPAPKGPALASRMVGGLAG
jgi:hypothetical protein